MLAIDCGNTRIKWARFDGGAIADSGAGLRGDAATLAALGAALAATPGRVLVANVAGAAAAAAIAELVAGSGAREAEFVRVEAQAHGIACAYREPATLGVDRWLGLIAARRRVAGAFAVIGAGTAASFDAAAADGRHLGGLILPGDGLMIEALAAQTAQLARVPRAGAAPAALDLLGRDTAAAVANGCRLALAAALDRAVAAVAEALASEVAVLLTGGDARLIAAWLQSPGQIVPDLVLEGLAIVAGQLE